MFKLSDFFHLQQVEPILEELIQAESGLGVVAGMDPRPATLQAIPGGMLPSGRTTIFRLLVDEILASQPEKKCVVVTRDPTVLRIPRQLRSRITVWEVNDRHGYTDLIPNAVRAQPGLLVIDQIDSITASLALEAASKGVRVLSQLDTIFSGAGVARNLMDLGASRAQLRGLGWVIAVQRMPALCPHCKEPAFPDAIQMKRFSQYNPRPPVRVVEKAPLDPFEPLTNGSGTYFQARGCDRCQDTGRYGDVAVFDIFQARGDAPGLFEQPSRVPMDHYVLHLAAQGRLSLEDYLQFEPDQLRRAFHLFTASESELVQANARLRRKVVEIESANRVLERRTRELFSLENIGQMLISTDGLNEMATLVCRRARELGGADRVVLYLLRQGEQVEVLGVEGWDPKYVHQRLDADLVCAPETGNTPFRYRKPPPGVEPHFPDVETLYDGLYVPLIAQEERVGAMIVHTVRNKRFAPGEVALMQTFANQAALGIQRAGLVDKLRAKIGLLEAAQVGLAQKERLEREMELARDVQENVLPHTFPEYDGYRFAARYESARQVGGDFYDVIELDENHVGIAIADVSDKGMPAALYMALTRSLLRAEARRERSPQAVVTNVNRLLLELGRPGMFVTVFYGVLEKDTRKLSYARAGHDRPLLLREGTVTELDGGGAALGLIWWAEFRIADEEITLQPGDRLVLYTDGLTDSISPKGELFDRERLIAILQSCEICPPEALCEQVFDRLCEYRGDAEQFDDMTMLVINVD